MTGPGAREVATYLYREFGAAGIGGMILGTTTGLAVLSVADDFAVWTDGRRLWWLEGGKRLRFHRVTDLQDTRRLVFGHHHERRRLFSGEAGEAGERAAAPARSVEETRAAGERLRDALAERGITRQDMDVFLDSRVAMIYAYGGRLRTTVTVAGGTYSWPATGCLRCRAWQDAAQTAAEIAGRLQRAPRPADPS
jgi:hypothetical protein